MLILTAGHEQIDPGYAGTLDADEHFTRRQGPGIGCRLGLQGDELLQGFFGRFGEFGDHYAGAGR